MIGWLEHIEHDMARAYPEVVSEHETVRTLLRFGKSIARFGDGEIKIVCGSGYSREPANAELAAEMKQILIGEGHPDALVGIWSNNPLSPKHDNQERYRAKFMRVIQPRKVRYYSSFISRPDSTPWIRNKEYAMMLASLWENKFAVVVCEKHGSMHGTVRLHARIAKHIACPRVQAYAKIDELERAVLKAEPEIAIISAGPTATCLANRLAAHGLQAIDLGSAGRWLRAELEAT
jgi:hypothetical protein